MSLLTTTIHDAIRLMRDGRLASATDTIKRKLFEISGVDLGKYTNRPQTYETPDDSEVIEGRGVRQPEPQTESSFKEHSYMSFAGSRRYKLFLPAGNHTSALPLVVMLHGCTQTPDDFALGTGMNELAALEPCVIVYPEQPTTANGLKCWNWFNASDQLRDQGEPAIIAGITKAVISSYALDATRVYVAGLSAGAAMAVVMGRTYPDLYAAVGVHSGLPYAVAHDASSAFAAMKGNHGQKQDTLEASQFVPTILLHGDNDKTVHSSNAEAFAQQFSSSDETSRPTLTAERESVGPDTDRIQGRHAYTRKRWHDKSGKVIVEYWLVHGAGHAWFGGNPRGSHTDPKGPDASKEILRFFLEHKLPT